MKKYFDILGLQEDASQEAIQNAYVLLSKELDPKNNDNQQFFVEEYEKLKEEYKALSNSTILKSSEKSYINTNIEEEPQEVIPKPNNELFTINISLNNNEELGSNSHENNNNSSNKKSFTLNTNNSNAKENSLSIFYFIIFLFVNLFIEKHLGLIQIIGNMFVLIFFTLFFELLIFIWKKYYKKNKNVKFYKGLNDFIETSFVYFIIWLVIMALPNIVDFIL